MPLFGPPNIVRLKAKGDVKGLIKALGYKKSSYVRQSAAYELGQIGNALAVEPLIIALKDEHKDVRRAAAEALGKLGDVQTVEPLSVTLKDKHTGVRRAAAEALAKIGAPAAESIVEALRDSDWSIRVIAVNELGQIGDALAVKPLIIALKDKRKEVRQAAAEALGKIGDTGAVEPLIVVLKDKVKEVAQVAAQALDDLGWQPDRSDIGVVYWIIKRRWDKCVEIGTPAVELLISALNDGDKNVRNGAVRALTEIGAASVEPLIAAIEDNNKNVRRGAALALGVINDPRAIRPLVTALKDENVREVATEALDKLGWQPYSRFHLFTFLGNTMTMKLSLRMNIRGSDDELSFFKSRTLYMPYGNQPVETLSGSTVDLATLAGDWLLVVPRDVVPHLMRLDIRDKCSHAADMEIGMFDQTSMINALLKFVHENWDNLT